MSEASSRCEANGRCEANDRSEASEIGTSDSIPILISADDFLNKEWEVKVSSGPTGFGKVCIIKKEPQLGEGKFGLYAKGEEKPVQILVFNPGNLNLEDDPRFPGPDRSISFWNNRIRGKNYDRIFAMRMRRRADSEDGYPKSGFLPWEVDSDGSWGADEDGGG